MKYMIAKALAAKHCVSLLYIIVIGGSLIGLTGLCFSRNHSISLSLNNKYAFGKNGIDEITNGLALGLNNTGWFIQVTDIHISQVNRAYQTAFEVFLRELVPVVNPRAVFLTGDISQSIGAGTWKRPGVVESEWKRYSSIVNNTGMSNGKFLSPAHPVLLFNVSAPNDLKYVSIQNAEKLAETVVNKNGSVAVENSERFWFDIRGNHDNWNVPTVVSELNYFRRYGVMGKTMDESRFYNFSVPIGNERLSFFAFDASPEVGLPFNLFGRLQPKVRTSLKNHINFMNNATANNTRFVILGHYPLSQLYYDKGQSLYSVTENQKVLAYLCGHYHLPRMYGHFNRHRFLELELDDFRNDRAFRIFAYDDGLFSFVDAKANQRTIEESNLPDFEYYASKSNEVAEPTFSPLYFTPIVLVLNPKDSHFLTPTEPLARIQRSSHIRVLVFHNQFSALSDNIIVEALIDSDTEVFCTMDRDTSLYDPQIESQRPFAGYNRVFNTTMVTNISAMYMPSGIPLSFLQTANLSGINVEDPQAHQKYNLTKKFLSPLFTCNWKALSNLLYGTGTHTLTIRVSQNMTALGGRKVRLTSVKTKFSLDGTTASNFAHMSFAQYLQNVNLPIICTALFYTVAAYIIIFLLLVPKILKLVLKSRPMVRDFERSTFKLKFQNNDDVGLQSHRHMLTSAAVAGNDQSPKGQKTPIRDGSDLARTASDTTNNTDAPKGSAPAPKETPKDAPKEAPKEPQREDGKADKPDAPATPGVPQTPKAKAAEPSPAPGTASTPAQSQAPAPAPAQSSSDSAPTATPASASITSSASVQNTPRDARTATGRDKVEKSRLTEHRGSIFKRASELEVLNQRTAPVVVYDIDEDRLENNLLAHAENLGGVFRFKFTANPDHADATGRKPNQLPPLFPAAGSGATVHPGATTAVHLQQQQQQQRNQNQQHLPPGLLYGSTVGTPVTMITGATPGGDSQLSPGIEANLGFPATPYKNKVYENEIAYTAFDIMEPALIFNGQGGRAQQGSHPLFQPVPVARSETGSSLGDQASLRSSSDLPHPATDSPEHPKRGMSFLRAPTHHHGGHHHQYQHGGGHHGSPATHGSPGGLQQDPRNVELLPNRPSVYQQEILRQEGKAERWLWDQQFRFSGADNADNFFAISNHWQQFELGVMLMLEEEDRVFNPSEIHHNTTYGWADYLLWQTKKTVYLYAMINDWIWWLFLGFMLNLTIGVWMTGPIVDDYHWYTLFSFGVGWRGGFEFYPDLYPIGLFILFFYYFPIMHIHASFGLVKHRFFHKVFLDPWIHCRHKLYTVENILMLVVFGVASVLLNVLAAYGYGLIGFLLSPAISWFFLFNFLLLIFLFRENRLLSERLKLIHHPDSLEFFDESGNRMRRPRNVRELTNKQHRRVLMDEDERARGGSTATLDSADTRWAAPARSGPSDLPGLPALRKA